MTHKEGDKSITVSFAEYETIEGIKLEKEIHRLNSGGPGAVIRFTKTVINLPVEATMFTTAP